MFGPPWPNGGTVDAVCFKDSHLQEVDPDPGGRCGTPQRGVRRGRGVRLEELGGVLRFSHSACCWSDGIHVLYWFAQKVCQKQKDSMVCYELATGRSAEQQKESIATKIFTALQSIALPGQVFPVAWRVSTAINSHPQADT